MILLCVSAEEREPAARARASLTCESWLRSSSERELLEGDGAPDIRQRALHNNPDVVQGELPGL